MSRLTRIVTGLAVVLAVAVGTTVWLGYREPASPPEAWSAAPPGAAVADASATLDRGRYLATVGNCMGCHTAAGGQAYAGGRALETPFGRFYGPNLTPDDATGIGQWTPDDFWRALHHGKSRDGSLLYPAFPYPTYSNVTRADADDIYAYLRALPAVQQPNRPHELDFPYNWRPLLSVWRALYFRPGEATAGAAPANGVPAGQGEQWLRGRYLVQGLAHCAECHTPRNRLGALQADASLEGGVMPGQGWYAPALTGDPVTGLGQWTAQDIAQLLQTGISAHSHASGPMGEAIRLGFQHVTDGDTQAMAVYLKSLPVAGVDAAAIGPVPDAQVMARGGKIYEQQCAQCHQASGEGVPLAWPPLKANASVVAPSPANTVMAVLAGGFAPSTLANPRPHGMPPFGQTLSDQDVAAVATYVRNSWGNRAGVVTLPQVRRVRDGR